MSIIDAALHKAISTNTADRTRCFIRSRLIEEAELPWKIYWASLSCTRTWNIEHDDVNFALYTFLITCDLYTVMTLASESRRTSLILTVVAACGDWENLYRFIATAFNLHFVIVTHKPTSGTHRGLPEAKNYCPLNIRLNRKSLRRRNQSTSCRYSYGWPRAKQSYLADRLQGLLSYAFSRNTPLRIQNDQS